MAFELAQRKNAKMRLAMAGPAGSGKTMSALIMAQGFGAKIGVLDSETGSASLYVGAPGVPPFYVVELEGATIQEYLEKIAEAAAEGIDVLVIDSYSHSWMATLEAVDRAGGWSKAGKTISPLTAKLVKTIQSYPGHVIATFRSKTDHVPETNAAGKVIGMTKIAGQPISRPDQEFEWTVWLDLTREGGVTVAKSRCGAALPMDQSYNRNDLPKITARLQKWIAEGAPVSAADALADRIKFAATEADLTAFAGKEIRTVAANDIEGARRCAALYKAKLVELQGAAPGVSEWPE